MAKEGDRTRQAIARLRDVEIERDGLLRQLADRRRETAPLGAPPFDFDDVEDALKPAFILLWSGSFRQARVYRPSPFFPDKADDDPIGALSLAAADPDANPWESSPAGLSIQVRLRAAKPEELAALARAVAVVAGEPKGEPYEKTLAVEGRGELVGQHATARFVREGLGIAIDAGDGPPPVREVRRQRR